MRPILLACLFVPCAAGFNVTSYSASPTQAILTYAAPDNHACTVEVSESGTYSPLVHDVDASLYSGANLDSRPGALQSDRGRIFLVGTRSIQRASDGRKYSRALQQGTLHYYRVTCGSAVATGTFTTKIIPFGATYQDLMPQNADGTYNFPDTVEDRSVSIIDSQTGVLMRRVNLDADATLGYRPPHSTAAGFGSFCADALTAQGKIRCLLPAFASDTTYLYDIDPNTGASTYLGVAMGSWNVVDSSLSGAFNLGSDFGELISWAPGSSTVIYAPPPVGRSTIVRWTYTGDGNPAHNKYAGYADGTTIDMLGGRDLNTLVHAFNPDFDNSLYHCAVLGAQANYAIFSCRIGDQGTLAWTGAFSFGNGIPMGQQGSTAGVVALNKMFANVGSRWCTDHSYEFLGSNVPISSFALDYMAAPTFPNWISHHYYPLYSQVTDSNNNIQTVMTAGVSGSVPPTWHTAVSGTTTDGTVTWIQQGHTYVGDGPFTVTLNSEMASFASGVADNSHETISVTSTWNPADGTPAPAAWQPGEPWSSNVPHFLQTIQDGDMFCFVDPNSGNCGEYLQLVNKQNPTTWVVERGVLAAQGGGQHAMVHHAGDQIILMCDQKRSITTYAGGYVFWDFVNSPHATEHAGDYALNWGSHPVTRGTHRAEYQFDPNAAPTNKAQWGTPAPYSLPTYFQFAGAGAEGGGNTYQKHPSIASGNDSSQFDVWYFVGSNTYCIQDNTCATPVGSYAHVYKYDPRGGAGWQQAQFNIKALPIFAKTNGRSLIDVSTPCSGGTCTADQLTDAVDNVWCKPNKDNECVMGSRAADPFIYFSLSSLNVRYCTGGENPTFLHDICFGNFPAAALSAVQMKFVNNDSTGSKTVRVLTRTFQNYEGAANLSNNLKMSYNGDWGLYYWVNSLSPLRTQVWALKVPPDPGSDGIDRGTFVPAKLNLSPPAGATQAQVKFWYAEQGGTSSTPYCTSRREACVATAAVISTGNPFSFAVTDSYKPAECANGCSITIPVYPLHTAYYSIEYLDANGGLISTATGLAMESTVVGLNAAPPEVRPTAVQGGAMQGATIQ